MVRARFPLSRRAMNRGIIASSRFDATSPTSTRDANARVFVRTSRPSVSPSRHIQHTSSTSSSKKRTRTRGRQSSIESTHARDEVYF